MDTKAYFCVIEQFAVFGAVMLNELKQELEVI